jgi:hypothetical protein
VTTLDAGDENGGGGGGGGGGSRAVIPVQRRRLDSRVLRRLQVRNSLDGLVWQVASWRGFDVTDQLPAVAAPMLHVHVAGDERAGHTAAKKRADVAALRRGHLAPLPGPFTHGLPYEDTAAFIHVAANFMDAAQAQEA